LKSVKSHHPHRRICTVAPYPASMTHTNLPQDTRAALWGTALHLTLWTLLMLGFWFHWKPAMIVGFFLTVANISGVFMPAIVNLICVLILLPFAPKTLADCNIRLFALLALIAQVWQFMVFIEGTAAH